VAYAILGCEPLDLQHEPILGQLTEQPDELAEHLMSPASVLSGTTKVRNRRWPNKRPPALTVRASKTVENSGVTSMPSGPGATGSPDSSAAMNSGANSRVRNRATRSASTSNPNGTSETTASSTAVSDDAGVNDETLHVKSICRFWRWWSM
jgi:hypothetical protein